MIPPRSRFRRPPADLRRRRVRLDNIALFPASQLPFKDHWLRLANTLPPDGVLVCVSPQKRIQTRICQRVSAYLRRRGKRVRLVATTPITVR